LTKSSCLKRQLLFFFERKAAGKGPQIKRIQYLQHLPGKWPKTVDQFFSELQQAKPSLDVVDLIKKTASGQPSI